MLFVLLFVAFRAPKPSLGLVTTKTSRTIHRASIRGFLEEHAVYLFSTFRVVATGRTCEFILGLCDELHLLGKLSQENTDMIRESLVKYPANSEGIVTVTHDLIEGRLPAVFHLSHYTDINTTFSSSVLRRQAAVHNVVYADSVEGCSSIVKSWRKHPEFLAQLKCAATTNHVDMTRFTPTQTNLALIAHDGKKLDMCLFFTQNLARILSHDRILATGTTGMMIRRTESIVCYFTAPHIFL
jgi:methylglyoxal synthase